MAKISAPFLSLGARGTVGKTLVAAVWKGQKYMRQHVVPSNPKSDLQVAHRALFSLCVTFWRTRFASGALLTGWNRAAALLGSPLSGFNLFVREGLKYLAAAPTTASMVANVFSGAASCTCTLIDLTGAGAAPVAGTYTLYYGDTPDALLTHETIANMVYSLPFAVGIAGKYARVVDPNGQPVSGVFLVPAIPA